MKTKYPFSASLCLVLYSFLREGSEMGMGLRWLLVMVPGSESVCNLESPQGTINHQLHEPREGTPILGHGREVLW